MSLVLKTMVRKLFMQRIIFKQKKKSLNFPNPNFACRSDFGSYKNLTNKFRI